MVQTVLVGVNLEEEKWPFRRARCSRVTTDNATCTRALTGCHGGFFRVTRWTEEFSSVQVLSIRILDLNQHCFSENPEALDTVDKRAFTAGALPGQFCFCGPIVCFALWKKRCPETSRRKKDGRTPYISTRRCTLIRLGVNNENVEALYFICRVFKTHICWLLRPN